MKECEKCPYCSKPYGLLICSNENSDNFNVLIIDITECDVFMTGRIAAGVENHTESFDFAAQVENDSDPVNHPMHYKQLSISASAMHGNIGTGLTARATMMRIWQNRTGTWIRR